MGEVKRACFASIWKGEQEKTWAEVDTQNDKATESFNGGYRGQDQLGPCVSWWTPGRSDYQSLRVRHERCISCGGMGGDDEAAGTNHVSYHQRRGHLPHLGFPVRNRCDLAVCGNSSALWSGRENRGFDRLRLLGLDNRVVHRRL